MFKVIVASRNPVKVKAALEGFKAMFSRKEIVIEGVDAASGVNDQPVSDMETYQGAFNRAENARQLMSDADYWVGIEGGIHERDVTEMEAFAWVVIISKNVTGKAKTATFQLPYEVTRLIHEGKELGEADDIVFGTSDSKKKNGAVGLLTKDVVDRTSLYSQAVKLALIPHINPTLY